MCSVDSSNRPGQSLTIPPDPNQVRSVDDEPSGEIEAVIADWEQRAEAREREAKASMVDELISEHRADTKFSGS